MTIKYKGTIFEGLIKKCNCGKKAISIKVNVYFGEIMNEKTGERYLDCEFEFLCQEHTDKSFIKN